MSLPRNEATNKLFQTFLSLKSLDECYQYFEDLYYIRKYNRKLLKKVDRLYNDILEHPFIGLGKPEPLRGDLSGFWSRRLSYDDRMIYTLKNDVDNGLNIVKEIIYSVDEDTSTITFVSLLGHYE